MPQLPIPQEKKDARNSLSHVLYEMNMLFEVMERRLINWPPKTEYFQINLLLQSFVMQARNLDEFFHDKNHPRRIQPTDFGFTDWTYARDEVQINRMNDEMSHLGYLRKADGEMRGWDLLTIAGTLTGPCRSFVAHVRAMPELMTETRLQICDQILARLSLVEGHLRLRHQRAVQLEASKHSGTSSPMTLVTSLARPG